MKTKKITLTNNFHHTDITVYAKPTDNVWIWSLSKKQVQKVNKALCGMAECACGLTRESRWDLETNQDGTGFLRSWEEEYNDQMSFLHGADHV